MEKTFLQQVGDRLHEGRIRRDFSRKTLAERAGVHISAVIRAERGEDIPLESMVKLCKELEFSIEYVLTGECGFLELSRMLQRISNMPNLSTTSLHRVATAFWQTTPCAVKTDKQ